MNAPGNFRQCDMLSDDLWAKVFLLLLPKVCRKSDQDLPFWGMLRNPTITRDYRCFQKLRLICHRFNKIFLQHPDLAACVYLDEHLSQDALPSLIPWLQRRSSAVRSCMFICDASCAEPALAALSSEGSALTAVSCRATNNTVSSLASMTSLTACDLQANAVEVALAPLSTLQSLRSLHLRDGEFVMAGLAGLTYLDLDHACVTCVNSLGLVNTMEELDLYESSMTGLHPEGLAALTALKSLSVYDSEIAAEVITQSFDTKSGRRIRLPAQMPVLNCMTLLDLTFCGPVEHEFDLGCLYTLHNLRELLLALLMVWPTQWWALL